MLTSPKKIIIADIRSLSGSTVLFCVLLYPVFVILFLLFGYPMMAGIAGSDNLDSFRSYYSVTAIALIASIPLCYGLLFSFLHLKQSHPNAENRSYTSRDQLFMRILFPVSLSFFMLLALIYLADPVTTEGWLRSIYAAMLLSLQTAFIYLFATCIARQSKNLKVPFLVSVLLLVTVPAGLLLHHPWNYFIFFSPFYWVSWAWIIGSPGESILYGIISLALTATGMLIFCRYLKA